VAAVPAIVLMVMVMRHMLYVHLRTGVVAYGFYF